MAEQFHQNHIRQSTAVLKERLKILLGKSWDSFHLIEIGRRFKAAFGSPGKHHNLAFSHSAKASSKPGQEQEVRR